MGNQRHWPIILAEIDKLYRTSEKIKSGGTIIEKSRNIENLHDLRLMALLHELVRDKGRRGAAAALGIDHRTVAGSIKGGRLSWRVREALEHALQSGVGSAAARQRERNDALEQRMETLAEELRSEGARTAIEGKIKALGDEYGKTLRQLERRLAQVEAGYGGASAASGIRKPVVRVQSRRKYPELVTREPAPDDEEIYGAAWPLVEEWRRLREGHPNDGRSLSWLVTEERILNLELAMAEEHGLTLPPETQPLRGVWRNGQRRSIEAALGDTRWARVRRERLRWVRRFLTLGLWWK